MLKLRKVVKYVVSKNLLSNLCLTLLEQKLQHFESLFCSLVQYVTHVYSKTNIIQ